MPELPEVETVVRGLRATLPGRRIVSVQLGKTDFMEDPGAIERELPGRMVETVERRGKFLIVWLAPRNRGNARAGLMVHLGMTGQLVTQPAAQPATKHTHAFFCLDDGRELRYVDIRRFGQMAVVDQAALDERLGSLGAEPLEVGEEDFAARLRSRQARVKALLLDQHVLRGIGNIYADESLWRARIHPARLGSKLTRGDIARLYRAIRWVLLRAIELRGSSISDYLDAEGRRGEFQRLHRAYGRKGKSCFRCGEKIRRATVAGRSSYYCPRCQSAPRKTGKRRARPGRPGRRRR
jgi:formamidopyrimidine-DNA glycosylase